MPSLPELRGDHDFKAALDGDAVIDALRGTLAAARLPQSDPGDVAAVSLRFSTVLAPSYVPLLVAGVMTGFIAFGILELQRHGFRQVAAVKVAQEARALVAFAHLRAVLV